MCAQIRGCNGIFILRNFFRSSRCNDSTTLRATAWTHIDEMISAGDHIEVMFNDDYSVT